MKSNYQAKIRLILLRGPFIRVDRGLRRFADKPASPRARRKAMKDNRCNGLDKQIGANIRRIRVLKGMSQEKLGQTCGGITFQQVQKYEKGTNRVGGSRIVLISRALGCEIKDLFEGVAEDGTGNDTPDIVSVSELTLLRNFRKISVSGGQHAIMAAVRAMSGAADQPPHQEATAA